jgi:hypothetical protein
VFFHQLLGEFSGSTAELDDGLGRTEVAELEQTIKRGFLVKGLTVLTTTESIVEIPGLLPRQDRAGYWGR